MYFIVFLFTERQKRPAPKEETEKKDEEEWQLKDVVFVEDVKSVPAGM
jgi:E3 ubiquitin-protein ligase EDD1